MANLLARDLPVDDLYARPHMFWRTSARRRARSGPSPPAPTNARLVARLQQYQAPLCAGRPPACRPTRRPRSCTWACRGWNSNRQQSAIIPTAVRRRRFVGVTDPDGNGVSGLELGLEPAALQRVRRAGVKPPSTCACSTFWRMKPKPAWQMFNAQAAGGMVMDVRTGEILALVSLPDFDPNFAQFRRATTPTATSWRRIVYELGSVFKILSFALALRGPHDHASTKSSPSATAIKIGKFTIHEAEHMPATLTARDVLAQSSNIGTAQIALRSGPARQRAFLDKPGPARRRFKSELPESARPLYPDRTGASSRRPPSASVTASRSSPLASFRRRLRPSSMAAGASSHFPQAPRADAPRRTTYFARDQRRACADLLRYVVTNGTRQKGGCCQATMSAARPDRRKRPVRHGYQSHRPRHLVLRRLSD